MQISWFSTENDHKDPDHGYCAQKALKSIRDTNILNEY